MSRTINYKAIWPASSTTFLPIAQSSLWPQHHCELRYLVLHGMNHNMSIQTLNEFSPCFLIRTLMMIHKCHYLDGWMCWG
ncbi:hypothetical protein THAOC_35146 [Thalassiosira oceanica]|uniref:Uncharacterized protein n=1 Tax=Thalassiosira oceanica TaxID=159749 RepID=K0RB06_THAOC|nr:hypothetical protein THAOC_35146 [Thalassiosira oceanica]|eukprot:EJK46196.1 hypothetical protein THAOC_35146 [Thalassiosira oceanica]